jgi:uncharacterized protein YdaU (DUF1376 family)
MTKKTDLWMPLNIKDYLGDTMHLSTLQHGAYLLLLMHYWMHGPLPDDDEALASIAKMNREDWDQKAHSTIRKFFVAQEDGSLVQKRAEIERAKASEISKKRSAAGRDGGTKSGQTRSKNEANTKQNTKQNTEQTVKQNTKQTGTHKQEQKEDSDIPDGISAAAPSPPPRDLSDMDALKKHVWDEGVRIIRNLTGKSDGPARTFLGKVLKALNQDFPGALAVLQAAERERPADPAAWIAAAAKARASPPQGVISPRRQAILEAAGLWPPPPGEDDEFSGTTLDGDAEPFQPPQRSLLE